jgi:hypothetical protein
MATQSNGNKSATASAGNTPGAGSAPTNNTPGNTPGAGSANDTPDANETVTGLGIKQAALTKIKVARHIRVPAQLAGSYMGARFDDAGLSLDAVNPDIIEALEAQFPGIQIEDIEPAADESSTEA